MANKLGQLNCFLSNGGNVGQGDCGFTPGLLIGHIYGPKKKEFTASEVADADALLTALQAGTKDDTYSDRLFPVKQYRDWAEGGEARQEQTFGDGTKRETRPATQQMNATIYGDQHYYRGVQKALHNKQGSLGALDVYNQGDGTFAVVGRMTTDASGNRVMGFFGLSSLTVGVYTKATGTTVPNFIVSTGYSDAIEHDTEFVVMLFDTNPLEEIEGLVSAQIYATSSAATTIHVKLVDSYGIDLINTYATELADVTNFKVYNDDPGSANRGNEVTISAVAADATGWTLTIAASGTDPDNPGTGKYVRVAGSAPSVLEGNDVLNTELIETRVALG